MGSLRLDTIHDEHATDESTEWTDPLDAGRPWWLRRVSLRAERQRAQGLRDARAP